LPAAGRLKFAAGTDEASVWLFDSDIDAVVHIVEYIEFYNRERLQSGINYQSPEKYEKLCA
jgi:transposase InsO family protein